MQVLSYSLQSCPYGTAPDYINELCRSNAEDTARSRLRSTAHGDVPRQLCIHCQPEDEQSAVLSVQQCVLVIEQWMAASRLRLNTDKTELMWRSTKYNLSKIPVCCHSLTLDARPSRRIRCRPPDLPLDKHITAVGARLISASTAAPHPTLARRLGRYCRTSVRRQPGRLLWQSLDRCAKEDDRQAAACTQCCGPNRFQHTPSTIEGCVSSGDASSTGWVPMTGFGSEWVSRCTIVYTTYGAWIPVDILPTRRVLRS